MNHRDTEDAEFHHEEHEEYEGLAEGCGLTIS
jgi:hypothetical protein